MEQRWDWETAAGSQLWLRPGEHVYWRGQPDSKKIIGSGDLFLVPFSLLWGGFAIFWEIEATRAGFYFGSVFGLAFVCIGLYFIFGRFFYKRWSRNRTRYCITDQPSASLWPDDLRQMCSRSQSHIPSAWYVAEVVTVEPSPGRFRVGSLLGQTGSDLRIHR
jgi:hypothetical protein